MAYESWWWWETKKIKKECQSLNAFPETPTSAKLAGLINFGLVFYAQLKILVITPDLIYLKIVFLLGLLRLWQLISSFIWYGRTPSAVSMSLDSGNVKRVYLINSHDNLLVDTMIMHCLRTVKSKLQKNYRMNKVYQIGYQLLKNTLASSDAQKD